jgi:protein O-mannosyl-transferase
MAACCKKTASVHMGALIFICLALFANSLQNEFVWDDTWLIPDNPHLCRLANIPRFFTPHYWNHQHPFSGLKDYRPIRTTTFALDYFFWKQNPAGYRLTNIVLHVINVLLVYGLIGLLTRNAFDPRRPSPPPLLCYLPFWVALLFAAHPVHTEAVVFIKNRSDLLACLFYLISFIVFVRGLLQDTGRLRVFSRLLAWGCFCLALLSKEMALTLPAVLMLYALCFLSGKKRSQALWGGLPFWLLALLFLWFRNSALLISPVDQSGIDISLWQTGQMVFKTMGVYFYLLVFPVNLAVEHMFSKPTSFFQPFVLFPAAAAAMLSVLMLVIHKKSRLASFGIGWVLLTLVPAANFVYLASRPIAEQRLYLPSLGFCLLLSVCLHWFLVTERPFLRLKNAVVLFVFIVIVTFYADRTIDRNRHWKNELVFGLTAVKQSPKNSRVHYNLGLALANNGGLNGAVHHFQKTLNIDPSDPEAYYNLGLAFAKKGEPEKAAHSFKAALQLLPDYDQPYVGLALVEANKGKLEKAIRHFRSALKINPDNPNVLMGLGVVLFQAGRIEEATKQLSSALQVEPNNANAHYNLGLALVEKGRFEEALGHFLETVRLSPGDADAYYNIGSLYRALGDKKQANRYYAAAIALNPDYESRLKTGSQQDLPPKF